MGKFLREILHFSKASGHTIAYDFETTGLDVDRCEIIEYCFFDVNLRVPICQSLLRP